MLLQIPNNGYTRSSRLLEDAHLIPGIVEMYNKACTQWQILEPTAPRVAWPIQQVLVCAVLRQGHKGLLCLFNGPVCHLYVQLWMEQQRILHARERRYCRRRCAFSTRSSNKVTLKFESCQGNLPRSPDLMSPRKNKLLIRSGLHLMSRAHVEGYGVRRGA